MQLNFRPKLGTKKLLIRRLVRESLDGCDSPRGRFPLVHLRRVATRYIDWKRKSLIVRSRNAMKRFSDKPVPIDQFPISWSHVLTDQLGNLSFRLPCDGNKSVPKEWLGIVSSHQNKNGFASIDWQQSLQSALHLASRQGWGVLFASETPYAQIVFNACKRYRIPFRMIRTMSTNAGKNNSDDAAIPELDECDFGTLWLQDHKSISLDKIPKKRSPVHDRASVFLAHHVFVIQMRDGGKIAELIKMRLSSRCIPSGSTFISLPSPSLKKTNPSPRRIREDWLGLGAIGWLTNGSEEIRSEEINSGPTRAWSTCFRRIDSLQSNACDTHQPVFPIQMLGTKRARYLAHCTRSRLGPWPDQSPAQFHDELLLRPWQFQPSAFDTLHRILTQQRLIATTRFRRGGLATVCMSSKEITKLLSMRRYQSHLARWDWEPYGIMFDLPWLEKLGAKQVSYIDPKTAGKMIDEDLAFCQVVSNESEAIDWREEEEWRIAGDLRLNQIPFSKAIVFVATQSEAKFLQPLSRWPIAFTRHRF